MVLTFTIPGPPQGWRAPEPGRRGQRHHSPPAMRAYKERVTWEALRAIPAGWPRTARRFRCDIDIYQRAAKPDRTNVQKLVEDALTKAGVWIDDCRVEDGYTRRVRDPRKPERVNVTVEVIA